MKNNSLKPCVCDNYYAPLVWKLSIKKQQGMDIILLLLAGWWLSGGLGFRERRKPRHRRKRSFWKPDMDEYDWEEFNKRNGR